MKNNCRLKQETKDIIVNNGRFGSYVKFGDKYYLTNKKTFIKTWK